MGREEEDAIRCEVREGVAVVRFGQGAFERGADLAFKERFHARLDEFEQSPDVRVLLLVNLPGALSGEEYGRFLAGTFNENFMARTQRDLLFSREENALTQFVLRVQRFNKVVVCGVRGPVATPGLGIALAADFRIASEETEFSFSDEQYGMPPGGALAFYLPRYVGLGKAAELMLTGTRLAAREAKDLNLVQEVFSEVEFEDRCFKKAVALASAPLAVATGTKAMLYPFRGEELEAFLRVEIQMMHRAWACEDLKEDLQAAL